MQYHPPLSTECGAASWISYPIRPRNIVPDYPPKDFCSMSLPCSRLAAVGWRPRPPPASHAIAFASSLTSGCVGSFPSRNPSRGNVGAKLKQYLGLLILILEVLDLRKASAATGGRLAKPPSQLVFPWLQVASNGCCITHPSDVDPDIDLITVTLSLAAVDHSAM